MRATESTLSQTCSLEASSHPRYVFREQMYSAVIRMSKRGEGARGACVFDISIQQVQCLFLGMALNEREQGVI